MIVKSIRQLAAQLGVSHTALNKHVRSGDIKPEEGGGYDVEKSRAAIVRNSSVVQVSVKSAGKPAPAKREPEPEGPDELTGNEATAREKFNKYRAHREKMQAKQAELDYRERVGELVELPKINAWVAGMIVRAATILDRIPDEMADRLAQLTDPIAVKEMLRRELTRARNELSEYRV